MTSSKEESFELRYDDEPERIIRGCFLRPAGQIRGAVLCLHGFKGFMHWGFFPELRERLAADGFIAVAFNGSGSGIGADLENFTDERGFERNSYTRELEDIERVRTHLDSLAPSWGLLGHSRGGGMALIHAVERGNYRAVVTWAAISTSRRFPEDVLDEWRRQGFLLIHNARTGQDLRMGIECMDDVEQNEARLDIQAACGRASTPTLLVHGSGDESVPYAEMHALVSAFPADVAQSFLLEGAGHTFGARHPYGETPSHLELVLAATQAHLRKHLG